MLNDRKIRGVENAEYTATLRCDPDLCIGHYSRYDHPYRHFSLSLSGICISEPNSPASHQYILYLSSTPDRETTSLLLGVVDEEPIPPRDVAG